MYGHNIHVIVYIHGVCIHTHPTDPTDMDYVTVNSWPT
jgi:hypothetical protein